MIPCVRKTLTAFTVSLALSLIAGCANPQVSSSDNKVADLRIRLVAANLLAGGLADGFSTAIHSRTITPDSNEARLIVVTLDAVDMSLDGASRALRTGFPDMAVLQIGAAESQLNGLMPLLPASELAR